MAYEEQSLRAKIEETKNDLNENLHVLESTIKNQVNTAKIAVTDAIDAVKSEAKKLSPVYQTTVHPFVAVGAAITTGVMVGNMLGRRPQNREFGARTPSPEIGIIKSAALAAVINFAAKKLSEAAPTLAPHIDEMVHHVRDRLGTLTPVK